MSTLPLQELMAMSEYERHLDVMLALNTNVMFICGYG